MKFPDRATPIPGVSYASIAQSPVKKVTVEDPIPGLKPLEKLKPKNTSEDQKNNSTSQTSPQATETNKTEKVLKKHYFRNDQKRFEKKKHQISRKQIVSDRQFKRVKRQY